MLENFERISKILSIAAIPIVLAVAGWLVQKQLAYQSTKKEYVQLAVSILSETGTSTDGTDLRKWAVELLNENSTIKLPLEATEKLTTGEIGFLGRESHDLWKKNAASSPVYSETISLRDGRSFNIQPYPSGDILIKLKGRYLWINGKNL